MSNLILTGQAWLDLKEQATMAVKSGLLPVSVDTPEKAIIIALKGRELGLLPMQAFSSLDVIEGQPRLKSEAMLALIMKSGGDVKILKSTNTECHLVGTRGEKKLEVTWTIEDAKTARLMANPSWQKYPKRMLTWRAVSEIAHLLFPDVIQGTHSNNEISAKDYYEPTDREHRYELNEIFKSFDVTDVDTMKKISERARGVDMEELKVFVTDQLLTKTLECPQLHESSEPPLLNISPGVGSEPAPHS